MKIVILIAMFIVGVYLSWGSYHDLNTPGYKGSTVIAIAILGIIGAILVIAGLIGLGFVLF